MTGHRFHYVLGSARVRFIDDTGVIQKIQIDEGPIGPDKAARIVDHVKRVQDFGFSSVPPIDAEILLARLGGDRSQTVAIGSNHQPSRVRNLKPGETVVYDVRGQKIYLSETGIIIDGATLPITVQNFGTATFHGDVHVTGDVVSRSAGTPVSLNTLHDDYNVHAHPGVAAGSASTGTTDHPD